jgi:hypothetical protein
MKRHFIIRKNTSIEKVVSGKTRVILISKDYGVKNAEPVWGSRYQCAGIVERIVKMDTNFPIVVRWDNGTSSAYKAIDLQICSDSDKEMKSNPNFTFKCAKRREQSDKESHKKR